MTHIFPPSPGETRWRAGSYLFMSGVGFYTMLFPDPTVVEGRFSYVSLIWSVFMLTAIPAAGAVLVSRYRVESILLPFFGSALIVATISVWGRVWFVDSLDLIPRACIATALICLLAVRGLQLHRIVKAKPWITIER